MASRPTLSRRSSRRWSTKATASCASTRSKITINTKRRRNRQGRWWRRLRGSEKRSQNSRRRLDSRPPSVALVFPIPAFAATDMFEALDEFDPLDIFRVLVAELAFAAQPHRCAVGNGEGCTVHLIGEDRLRMAGFD